MNGSDPRDRSFALATAAAGLWTLLGAGSAWAQDESTVDNDTCLACHADDEIEAETDRGRGLNLAVAEDALAGTVHEDLDCVECHTGAADFDDVPHNEGKPLSFGCADCHDEAAAEYSKSVHGRLQSSGDSDAPRCSDCHDGHKIYPGDDRRSTVNKFRLSVTCAKCHQGGAMLKTHSVADPEAVTHYLDSIHGKSLLVDGVAVAPTCNDCHGVHNILPHEDSGSLTHGSNVPKTCGQCHVLVEDIYNSSVHGRLLASGDKRGPTCVNCHTSHEIERPRALHFKLSIDQKCGACHEDKLERYRETFHGKAIALGREGVATCYDCHGYHRIEPSSAVNSKTHTNNVVATCASCHPDANPNFAAYKVHASHLDREDAPEVFWTFVL